MEKRMFIRVTVVALLIAGSAGLCNAAVSYTDQATFLGALNSVITEDFESYAAGTVITNQLAGITAVTTNGNNGSTQAEIGSIAGLPFPMTAGLPTSSGDRFLSSELRPNIYATAGLNFDLDTAYNGVGFYVCDGAPLGQFNIQIYSGVTLVDSVLFPAQTLPNSFIGVVSAAGFDSVRIDSVADGDSWGIDDLSIGSTAAAVPAPGAALLASLGATVVGWLRRRKSI